ncbi:MAG: prepilin-type N-terminal cleavage/methylation domain-containing protein [Candidatus Hydrogenedentes bacterium]|nr:prepilin-type N-terminal cleavage/methylation domain-containing protein [Candidatus Hydrogenedentota bacterium]
MSERKGFTLIEVLIAMVILGVGIIAIFKMFPDSLRQARVAAERTIVAELASSRLCQVRAAGAENLLRSTPSFLSAVTTAAITTTSSERGQTVRMA